MDKDRELLSKLLVIMLASFGVEIEGQIKDMLQIWIEELVKHDYKQIEHNIKQLMRTFKPEYGRKWPCLAEILGTTEKDKTLQLQSEIDRKWEYFKRNMCNNLSYSALPEDIALWKRLLGVERCESMTEASEPWLKKEFIDIYQNTKEKSMLMIEPKITRSEFVNLINEAKKQIAS